MKSYFDVINPATRKVFHRAPAGSAEDIDQAVRAAKKAFESWSETTGAYRAK